MKLIFKDTDGSITISEANSDTIDLQAGQQIFLTGVQPGTQNIQIAADGTVTITVIDRVTGEPVTLTLPDFSSLINGNDPSDPFSLDTAMGFSTTKEGDKEIEDILNDDSLEPGEIIEKLKEALDESSEADTDGAIIDSTSTLLNFINTAAGEELPQSHYYDPQFLERDKIEEEEDEEERDPRGGIDSNRADEDLRDIELDRTSDETGYNDARKKESISENGGIPENDIDNKESTQDEDEGIYTSLDNTDNDNTSSGEESEDASSSDVSEDEENSNEDNSIEVNDVNNLDTNSEDTEINQKESIDDKSTNTEDGSQDVEETQNEETSGDGSEDNEEESTEEENEPISDNEEEETINETENDEEENEPISDNEETENEVEDEDNTQNITITITEDDNNNGEIVNETIEDEGSDDDEENTEDDIDADDSIGGDDDVINDNNTDDAIEEEDNTNLDEEDTETGNAGEDTEDDDTGRDDGTIDNSTDDNDYNQDGDGPGDDEQNNEDIEETTEDEETINETIDETIDDEETIDETIDDEETIDETIDDEESTDETTEDEETIEENSILEFDETTPILNINEDEKITFTKEDILKNISDEDEDIIEIGEVKTNVGIITEENGEYTLDVPENFNGTIELSMTATDGHVEIPGKTLITVQPVNDAPEATFINPTILEDESVIIDLEISDVDSENLTVEIFQGPDNGTAIINEDGNIEYTPVKDYNGNQEMTIKISDGEEIVYKTIEVTVSPVNDEPSIEITQDLTIDEDSNGIISFDMQDIDGDNVNFTVQEPGHGTIIVDGTQVTYIPDENYNGADALTINYTDGVVNKSSTVNIDIKEVNDEPYIETINEVHMIEDEVQEILMTAGDIEGNVDIKVEADNGVAIIDEDGNIVYSPNVDFNGVDTIAITAIDEDGVAVYKNVNVQIDNDNSDIAFEIKTETIYETHTEIVEHTETREVHVEYTREVEVIDEEANTEAGITQNSEGEWVTTETQTEVYTEIVAEEKTREVEEEFTNTRIETEEYQVEHEIEIVDQEAMEEDGWVLQDDGTYTKTIIETFTDQKTEIEEFQDTRMVEETFTNTREVEVQETVIDTEAMEDKGFREINGQWVQPDMDAFSKFVPFDPNTFRWGPNDIKEVQETDIVYKTVTTTKQEEFEDTRMIEEEFTNTREVNVDSENTREVTITASEDDLITTVETYFTTETRDIEVEFQDVRMVEEIYTEDVEVQKEQEVQVEVPVEPIMKTVEETYTETEQEEYIVQEEVEVTEEHENYILDLTESEYEISLVNVIESVKEESINSFDEINIGTNKLNVDIDDILIASDETIVFEGEDGSKIDFSQLPEDESIVKTGEVKGEDGTMYDSYTYSSIGQELDILINQEIHTDL